MNRTLKVSSRPFVALGIMCGSICGLFVYGSLRNPQSNLLQAAASVAALYVLIMVSLFRFRVTVTDESIVIRRLLIFVQRVRFADIDHSDVQFLGERDWPLSITIHSGHRQPVISLGLKVIRQKDAIWLCSLPQLKCVTHAGLTRRA